MKVVANGLPAAIREDIESWGWELADDPSSADAILSANAQHIEIRAGRAQFPDDVIFPPFEKDELALRIEAAQARRSRLAKRLHDLRSPLNAIQGYAEMIVETADGDALRFASNIRTASETLTGRLEIIRDEGV